METDKSASQYSGEIRRIAEDRAVHDGAMRVVSSGVAQGEFQTPEAVERFRERAHGLIDRVAAFGGYEPERTTELMGLVDQGIAQGLNPETPTSTQ